jgi:exopolyphosphatase / guanosine-5'-triphosphate,3'-diphosphate pyrophosphatase
MIAIDLGSNTIRFIEYDGECWGQSFEKIVKTAESLYDTQQIGDNALGRILDAIREAKTKLDFSAHDIVGYTTAAMRLALNANQILDTIEMESGIRFTIIDAEKEADLTLNAVRNRLDKLGITPTSFVLADIGGGSTELIRFQSGMVNSVSLNMGIVTLSESAQSTDKLNKNINVFMRKVQESLDDCSGMQLVLTAGTPTTIAAYLNGMDYESYNPEKINGYCLKLKDCYRVYDELLNMEEASRSRYVGVGREKLIVTGILMVTSIYTALNVQEAIIIDDGLREGIALEYFELNSHIF